MAAPRQPVLSSAVLEGRLVDLRPVCEEDAEVAFGLIHGRRPILDWLVWQGPTDIGELRQRFAAWRSRTEAGHSYGFAIVERTSGEFVGTIGLRCAERLFRVEFGYWLAEAVWGRGFGTEAVRLAAHLAFRHLSATVITAEVFVGNHASCRVLEHNGFRRERILRRVPELPVTAPGHERWIYTLTLGDFGNLDAGSLPVAERVERLPPS